MRRKNAFLSCCLTLCLAVGMTVSVPVSAAAKTSTETQKSYPKYETYYVVNCKESITLRPQPDVSSGELCQIPYGSAVSYIESAQNGFYKIVYNGATGYGLAAYLSTDKPADSYYSSSSQPSTIMYPTYYVVNCKQSITLRTSPSTSASEICQIHVMPMVNPDGVAISQKGLSGLQTEEMRTKVTGIAALDGQEAQGDYLINWKSNGCGIDLNRNFDALWDSYADPVGHPSSSHYKGPYPGSEKETDAMITLTEEQNFARTVSYHAQGNVIYWYFGQEGQLYEDTKAFGERISALTGYVMDADYQSLDPAGYKDWAISQKGIPSLTIEVGRDTVPVPEEQFDEIWNANKNVWEECVCAD